jgi:rubrerythrin
MAHIAWCPNHDPDEPVPLALTPKAHAALNQAVIWLVDECPPFGHPVDLGPADDGPADEWACVICGDAYFGTRPADERCPGCRDDG